MTFRADIFAGRFPADPKILRNQLPTKVLPGNRNPWENPYETRFLRNFGRYPQEISQEKSRFLVVIIKQNRTY